MRRRPGVDERGQAALIVLVFALFFLMLIGLVSDGGRILSQRRDLQGLADGAARAGALAGNQNASRSGQPTKIDPAAAQAEVAAYLVHAGYTGTFNVAPATTQVTVDLTDTYPLDFARLLGISTTTLHATATSNPVAGQ
jgi:uncharacterized membrane protein